MATIIPADRFESNSPYAFILRENPRASGIEIQFPLDCTEVEWKDNTRWTNTERSNIRDRISQSTSGFISVIEKEGFQQANGNPFLWWVKVPSPAVFIQKMGTARRWVNKCSRLGAYEIEASIPVEQTKSRRRKPATPASQPQVEVTPNSTLIQPSGNKLADALSEAIAPRLASVLLPQIMEAVGASQQTKELEREIDRLRMQVEDLQEVRAKYEVENMRLHNERDAALARIEEMESAAQELGSEVAKFRELAIELERDRDSLKLTLAEVGLDPSLELTQPELAVNWDESPSPEPVSWDDDEDTSQPDTATQSVDWDEDLGESRSSSESKDEHDVTDEKEESEPEEGFDPELLESLGE
jgi:hypothetical protein